MRKVMLTLLAIISFTLAAKGQDFEKRIDVLIEKAVNINRFNGSVLVSKNGKIVYEKAYGYQNVEKNILNSTHTIYQIGSTTKEFTAAVILKLIENHQLSLDDKLSTYFPDFNRGNEITIKNLLTHTSGIYEILRDRVAFNGGTKPRSKKEMLCFFYNKPLDFDPGTQYSYCNSGYMLLGLIIEKVTGKPYEQVVKDFILEPLEMKHSGFDFTGLQSPNKAIGYSKYTKTIKEASIPWDSTATYSAGSLYSTVEDLYRWHNGLLNYKVYSKTSLDKATTPFLEGYGLGCWVDMIYDKKVVSHGGNIFGFTGYFGRIQEEDVSIIILNNIFNRQIETIGLSILAILYDKPYSYFDEIKLMPNTLDKYVGEYEISSDYRVKILRKGNQLFIERNNGTPIEIFAYQDNNFFQKDDDIRISFKSEKDTVNKISIMEGLNTKKGNKITP
ncbi:MAG: beta-lactamase family protein [Flavobacterium sp.]|nr:beta-lactamase family protein [Flavobacterium sp.]